MCPSDPSPLTSHAQPQNPFKATYQGDQVWFIKDESYRDGITRDAVVYTLAEARTLVHRSAWTRKMVHQAKKAAQAKIVNQLRIPLP
jgi:hypothetical protein